MKAVVYEKFGPPELLHLKEIEKPIPKKGAILIKIKTTSVNAYDWRHLRADPYIIHFMGAGMFKPKHPVLGADMAGVVEMVGENVTKFKRGDEVFGEGGYGGFAEYACVDENAFVLKPATVTFENAAASPMAALTALQGLRDYGKIKSGQKVLINGASGGVGSFAVQIAKTFGTDVTGVCSTSKMDMVLLIGADNVIDYKKEDVTKLGEKYDLIFDTAAFRPVADYRRILNPGGKYVVAGGSIRHIFQLMIKSKIGARNAEVVMARVNAEDLKLIGEMLENGKVKPAIDKVFPLEETAKAVRYVEDGKVLGKVVVLINKE